MEHNFPILFHSKIESKMRKAIKSFAMIEEDRIAVALSGGKDSLTLLHFLHKINGFGVRPFRITAFFVSGVHSCGPSMTKDFLEGHVRQMGIELVILGEGEGKMPTECYSCARVRRKMIFDAMRNRGITTVAFGHHKDDVNETLLLNLLQKGEFAAMEPKIYFYRYGVTLIRPLYFVEEKEIVSFARGAGFLRFVCQCPIGQHSKRKETKMLLEFIQKKFPHTKTNLFHAIENYGSKKALLEPKK